MNSKILAFFFFILSLTACNQDIPKNFSKEALNDKLVQLNGEEISFQSILDKHKGSTILIDIWASWCRDCIEGLPEIKNLQDENKDITYVFISLDRSIEGWKKGIVNYKIDGEHYFMQSGWDGPLGDFVDLDWIPRYMIIDKNQNLKLFKAVKATDINIKKALK
ncbi:Thioredoxin-like [Flavobacteriaceae bacterium MAR_2010_188]|nr:Thioredoxin-like [Flavobacteriaceae bacterium MAR_2010_188]